LKKDFEYALSEGYILYVVSRKQSWAIS